MSARNQPMGEVMRDRDKWVLRYERVLRHAPEKVWAALTESEHLRHWMPCDIVGERGEGADLELPSGQRRWRDMPSRIRSCRGRSRSGPPIRCSSGPGTQTCCRGSWHRLPTGRC
jgi:Activator of Hsp90 ATPase homolog 1-like protein